MTLTPGTASVKPGQNARFTATVVGATNNSVQWKATGGTIDASGNYTAGSNPGTYTVTAASVADPQVAATATVTVDPAVVAVSINPSSASVQTGQQTHFTASVTGSSNTAVSWTASCGSIDASGNYTAGNAAGTCTVTAASQANSSATATATVTVTAPPPAPAPAPGSNSSRLFTNASADWLYSAPAGTGQNISGTTGKMGFGLDTHDGGFDYPVQYTDGTHGCTTFTDSSIFGYKDNICVPNPANGFHPSTGGWGANDGHLVVVNTATRMYYDFWKLLVDRNGNPTSTNVGQIVEGSLDKGNGTPGTTAAVITGLAGDIMPGELDCATCLNHALQAVVPGGMNSGNVCKQAPAEKTDGGVGGAIFCEGAKLRFDPSINVDSLNVSTAAKAILHALQNYGAVITDQSGGNGIAFYTALPSQPDLTGFGVVGQHMLIYY